MPARLTIGDFARMTHLSVKALRHYHDLGLLEPAEVDPGSGYRLYHTDQVPTAQVIRRFRALGMPVEGVKGVLKAPDVATRNQLIADHLRRMESQLEQTTRAVASLRALLEPAQAPLAIEYRAVPRIQAAAITATVAVADLASWMPDAFDELYRALRAAGVGAAGASGGLFATPVFTDEIGEVSLFVPIDRPLQRVGRVRLVEIPAAELAIALHAGPLDGADRTYGALGTYVAERSVGVEGAIREHYLVGSRDTLDESRLRTEIGWPVFRTLPREAAPASVGLG